MDSLMNEDESESVNTTRTCDSEENEYEKTSRTYDNYIKEKT